jgi:uncharacterized repeat protein (TIGR03803 family)
MHTVHRRFAMRYGIAGVFAALCLVMLPPGMAARSAPAAAQQVLWSFQKPQLGNPLGRLLFRNGDLYGTASAFDSDGGNGQVFRLRQSNGKWSATSIVEFDRTDGSEPFAGMLSSSGTLYGTTPLGNSSNCGSVFSVSRSGGQWLLSTIWSFSGGSSDGCQPLSDLVMDSAGNIFGTTTGGGPGGGSCAGGCGTVFELSPQQGGGWTETLLHSFDDEDGALPRGGLFRDKAGNLFGTTAAGDGTRCYGVGCGTVFELSPTDSGWNFSNIHVFEATDGGMPWGVLIEGPKGMLYGTTTGGGSEGGGTAFALARSKGAWTETVLYNFKGSSDGGTPQGGLRSNGSGGFFGTTFSGGQSGCEDDDGCGVVFDLTESGGVWSETVLYSFSGGSDGGNPAAAVILDKSGNLYSTSCEGGAYGYGTVWELTP